MKWYAMQSYPNQPNPTKTEGQSARYFAKKSASLTSVSPQKPPDIPCRFCARKNLRHVPLGAPLLTLKIMQIISPVGETLSV
jgi:hypothetical protein